MTSFRPFLIRIWREQILAGRLEQPDIGTALVQLEPAAFYREF
ncbi:hypothetical protein ACVWZ3_008107 [Bradyrhizobium sp. i1.3.6]